MSKASSDSPGRVLSASFIEKHKSKNDLVRRLRTVVDALGDDDVEPNSPDYPGLASLASALVEDRFLCHRDKEVRLHTVLACMEIFYLYAPDPPWYEAEILKVFSQMIRQLANLAHCTSPSQANFKHYFRLLEQLSEVKIGVVLVELTRTLDSDAIESTDSDAPSSEEALEMLADLIRTILHSVHIDHPPEVASHAVAAVSACIEEFDGTVPIPVLDEILTCVGEGPVVYVTNPAAVEAAAKAAKKKEKPEKMPPMQIQQTNPSYMAASAVIRRTVDRISTPIASLLNGILNGDTNVIAQTTISSSENPPAAASSSAFAAAPEKQATGDVWTIIYELHRISPQILTTVIGTVTNSLQSPNLELRLRVTRLLGRLFYSPNSKIGVQFNPCFREWIRRSTDIEPKVRQAMVKYLVTVLSNKGQEELLASETSAALVKMIEHDPSLDVRLQAIHQVCDLAYKAKDHTRVPPASGATSVSDSNAWVSPRLLQAVGNRVSSKNKTERRDALTGLAQIYFRHYVAEKLKQVQSGGDDCDIAVILDALHDTGCGVRTQNDDRRSNRKRKSLSNEDNDGSLDLDEKYGWIPRKVFESACFTDSTDPEMRNRVVQIVDDVLLGSGASNGQDGKSQKEALTPTSRAVGLAFIVDSLRDEGDVVGGTISSNAYKWACTLFARRASLQRALGSYIDARTKLKKCKPDTEEALAAEAEAMERLETVASLTAPTTSSGSSSSPSDLQSVLSKFHSARDKHIFRILATIASPTHSASARARAFNELPKRTKSLGSVTAAWVKVLARRCAMGHFVNVENIGHCILLAQECFHEHDLPGCMAFLSCIKMAVTIYPTLCGTKESFGTLVELFGECRAVNSSKKKKEIEESGIVTVLSVILAAAAPARASRSVREKDKESSTQVIDSDLQKQLLNLCTRDGTPQQAKFAVYTMSALLRPAGSNLGSESLNVELGAFGPLLKALTSPTRMTLTTGSNGSDNAKIISVLTALAALAECAPVVFNKDGSASGRGDKAIRFALETILLGQSHSHEETASDDEEESSDDEDEEPTTPASTKSRRRHSKGRRSESETKHSTPGDSIDVLEDTSLSVACRRACAAIDFLASHIRSTVAQGDTAQIASRTNQGDQESETRSRSKTGKRLRDGMDEKSHHIGVQAPSPQHIQQVFYILTQILRDNGLPPSSRDRRNCRSRQDRAALRQCAAVQLLRLCDGRLKLERTYLSAGMWHILSGAFLDEECVVRDAVMEQLSLMLRGAFAPSLRSVAFIAVCVDGEHGAGHSAANGNAAYVGKRTVAVKNAAFQCISSLRKTCDTTLAQCRARGREAEKKFEEQFKMMLMPEFAVPYALHLLSFRRETPSAGGTVVAGMTQTSDTRAEYEEEGLTNDEDGRHKVLKKRLKWLFEPLVQSLGDGADNISFLLRMVDLVGGQYQPRDVSRDMDAARKSEIDDESSTSTKGDSPVKMSSSLSAAKLKTICVTAREVLLSFVKKDVNLTPYPGAVQVPVALFTRLTTSEAQLSQSSVSSQPISLGSAGPRTGSPVLKGSPSIESVSLGPIAYTQRSRESIDSAAQSPVGDVPGGASVGSTKRRSARNVRGRASVDSASHDSIASERKGRVHFSPEVNHGGEFFKDEGAREPAGTSEQMSSTPIGSQSPDGFGGLSPIHSSFSPSPNLKTKPRGSKSDSSEKVTLGPTPPSILRSREPGPTLSASSEPSDESSMIEIRRTRRTRNSSLTESDASTTLSVHKPSEEENESPATANKRKPEGDAGKASSSKRRRKPSVIQIKMGRSEKALKEAKRASLKTKGRKRLSAREAEDLENDEFDFPSDGEDLENIQSDQPERKKRKSPRKRSGKTGKTNGTKHIIVKPAKEVSLGSDSSPDMSESSSITKLKRGSGTRTRATNKRKVSVTAQRRTRRNKG